MESGRAVQFISIDPDTGLFEINQEAASILKESENQVAIISIAGKYRTGKSLLMNLLSGTNDNNFKVSPSVNACTRGVWFYSEPITIKKDEEIIDIYVMDSEGLGGVDKNQDHDVQIFTLTMLLSSFFIYNSYGVIDENALSTLSLVTALANKIQTLEDEEDAIHLINHFPTFLWVLRDFVLDLKDDDGNDISSDQYLEFVLEETYSDHPRAEEHNAIRATIKRFFPERYCTTLVRPVDEERDLQALAHPESYMGENTILKPEFVSQIDEFRNFILNQITVKSVGDISLSGGDYISVVVKYVEAINDGAVPKIEDSWTAVVESQLSVGYSRALKAYEDDIKNFENESIPCNEDDLERAHKGIMQASIDVFLEVTKGFDNQEKQEAYDTLQENIEGVYEAIKKVNSEENEDKLSEKLNGMYRNEIISKEFKSVEEYISAWKQFQDKFLSENESYKKYEVWSNFSLETIHDGINRITKKADVKRELKDKQLELEYNKLKTEFELKTSDATEVDHFKRQIETLKHEKVDYHHKEQELKREVVS
jgi:hypothetical protein